VIEEAKRVVREKKLDVQLSVLQPFYDQPEYIEALAASARPHLEQDYDHLLLSFHGLPESHIRKLVKDKGHDLTASSSRGVHEDVMAVCYRSQCLRTAEDFAAGAGLEDGRWSVSFQSRLGRAKWIEPYTETRLDELGKAGVRKLLVMCPAFVADCIETLEEIGDRGREQFIEAGGEELTLVPCLNDHPQWVEALTTLCERA
jgi:ferrochelatase